MPRRKERATVSPKRFRLDLAATARKYKQSSVLVYKAMGLDGQNTYDLAKNIATVCKLKLQRWVLELRLARAKQRLNKLEQKKAFLLWQDKNRKDDWARRAGKTE